jgi:hypothetical protein
MARTYQPDSENGAERLSPRPSSRPLGSAGGGPRVDLRIDQIVVNEAANGNLRDLEAEVERELSRLFERRGVPEWLMTGGAEFQAESNYDSRPDATTIGMRIARAIYKEEQ